jgi:hypothetical protein
MGRGLCTVFLTTQACIAMTDDEYCYDGDDGVAATDDDDDDLPLSYMAGLTADFQRAVAEISAVCMGLFAALEMHADGSVFVYVGVSPARLGVDAETCRVWGLSPDADKHVMVRVNVPWMPDGLPDAHLKPTVKMGDVRQGDPSVDGFASGTPIMLRWYVANRLGAALTGGKPWPPPREALFSPSTMPTVPQFLVDEVVFATGGCTDALATAALRASGLSVAGAVGSIMERAVVDRPLHAAITAITAVVPGYSGVAVVHALRISSSPEDAVQWLLDEGDNPTVLLANRDHEPEIQERNMVLKWALALERVLAECNTQCMVCGSALDYVSMKPTVCANVLCLHGYTQHGMGMDVVTELRNNTGVASLLLSMFCEFVRSPRIDMSFPVGVADGVTTAEQLREVLTFLPPVRAMASFETEADLKTGLHAVHPALFPLLRWLFATNRAHIRQVPPFADMPPDTQQYLLVTGPVEREARFQKLKAARGSIFAWHGSWWGNWHNIVRTGLLVLSNSKYMTTGAAYGKGVYFAGDLGTSAHYCMNALPYAATPPWPHSEHNDRMCFALCEIVNCREKFVTAPVDFDKPGWNGVGIFVVADEEIIATRMLFVVPRGALTSYPTALSFTEEVRAALACTR